MTGLTHCYKTAVFYILFSNTVFAAKFNLHSDLLCRNCKTLTTKSMNMKKSMKKRWQL